MAKSSTTDIADAVVDVLNTGTFSSEFTAVRLTLPLFDLKDLDTLRVTVIPRGRKTEIITRSDLDKTHTIEIGIQKRVNNVNDAIEIDSIGVLVEEIEEAILGQTLSNGATCYELENIMADDSIFAKDHIQQGVWTSVLIATYAQ